MNIKRKIIKYLSLLANNPRLFFKLMITTLNYRVTARLFLHKIPVRKRIKGVLFEFDFALDPKIKDMYYGYYELETIEVMRTILKPGDIFIDVGANIGYLSAVGAGLVGKDGQVHSFEPIPQYFQKLEKFVMFNPDYRIIVNRCALGEEEGMANINVTNLQNIGWNTMVPGLMRKETVKKTFKVPVYRLDNYIRQRALKNISLIKIDVEGFEFSVLRGLSNYFENTDHRPVIICEIFPPTAYSLLGYTCTQMLEYMRKYNYNTYSLVNIKAKVDITQLKDVIIVVFRSSA